MGDENTPLLSETSSPSKNIFEKIASYINLFLICICFIIIIVLSGVKAWCSAVVVFVISIIYAFLLKSETINTYLSKYNLTISSKSVSIGVVCICYIIVIALSTGFGAADGSKSKTELIQTTVNAAQNGLLFMGIVLIIILIPGSVDLFGNTFGYWIVSSFSNKEINDIIRPLLTNINDTIKQNTNYSFLITLDAGNILDTIRKINENTNDDTELINKIDELKPSIQKKTAIGYIIWVSLASIATVITTLSKRTFYD